MPPRVMKAARLIIQLETILFYERRSPHWVAMLNMISQEVATREMLVVSNEVM
jgi:hypothetical protein